MESNDMYWQQWEKLLEAAANIQKLFPEAVLAGGSVSAVHLQHRYSFDADHLLSRLETNYEAVLDFLENRDDWKTARLNPPKLILGNFQGVETGIRQLRRNISLDTETIDFHGRQLTVPTIPEMIRIKGWMIVCRNAARDYIDFAALVEHAGLAQAVGALDRFDECYLDLIRGREASPMIQLVRQLAEPNPYDLDDIDVSQYKGIRAPLSSWDHIRHVCEKMAAELGDRLAE